MASSSVTIVVVPRDHFAVAADSLESIYQNTPPPFNLIYVDGKSPRALRKHLERESASRGFRLVRSDHYLSPNQARNVGLHLTDTEYIVFVDNDVFPAPGWLEALVTCAEETGAWVVGPLYCAGLPLHETIHMAGGFVHIEEVDGRRMLKEGHSLTNAPLRDVRSQLHRMVSPLVEFHTLLARTEVLKRLGGLDPALLSAPEHIDLCLAVQAAGGSVYLEPAATISFLPIGPLPASDLPYYLLRWSEDWSLASLRHFAVKWRLPADDEFIVGHADFLNQRRLDGWGHWRRRIRKVFGEAAGDRIERRLERLLMGREPDLETLIALHAR